MRKEILALLVLILLIVFSSSVLAKNYEDDFDNLGKESFDIYGSGTGIDRSTDERVERESIEGGPVGGANLKIIPSNNNYLSMNLTFSISSCDVPSDQHGIFALLNGTDDSGNVFGGEHDGYFGYCDKGNFVVKKVQSGSGSTVDSQPIDSSTYHVCTWANKTFLDVKLDKDAGCASPDIQMSSTHSFPLEEIDTVMLAFGGFNGASSSGTTYVDNFELTSEINDSIAPNVTGSNAQNLTGKDWNIWNITANVTDTLGAIDTVLVEVENTTGGKTNYTMTEGTVQVEEEDVAYYALSDLTDQWGSNDLTNSGATSVLEYPTFNSSGSGSPNSSSFDNSNDFLDANWNPTGLRTVSVWFKTDGNQGAFVSQRFDSSEQAGAWFVGHESQIQFTVYTGSASAQTILSDSAVNDDAWHHAVVTVDSVDGMAMWVDGVKQTDTNAQTQTLGTADEDIHLGRLGNNGVWDWYYGGEIDEVKFFGKALTKEEIDTLYNDGKFLTDETVYNTSFTANQDGVYSFKVFANDTSGNNNNGSSLVTTTAGSIDAGLTMHLDMGTNCTIDNTQYVDNFLEYGDPTHTLNGMVNNLNGTCTFDGNDAIETPWNSAYRNSDLTYSISGWFAWDGSSTTTNHHMFSTKEQNNHYVATAPLRSTSSDKAWFETKESGSGIETVLSNTSFTSGIHHFTAIHDSTTMKLYIDGEFHDSNSSSNDGFAEETQICWGARCESPPDRFWNGNFSQLLFSNQTFSQEEIDYLYNSGNGNDLLTASLTTNNANGTFDNGFNSTNVTPTNYNMTSEGGCTVWNTNKQTACNTTDSTPTVKFDTNVFARCAIGITDSNYSTLTNTPSRNCSTTESTNHVCTLIAGDSLEFNQSNVFVGCEDLPGTQNSTSSSGGLSVYVEAIPTTPTLLFPENGSNISYNQQNWTYLNFTPGTDANDDQIHNYVFINGNFVYNTTNDYVNHSLPKITNANSHFNWSVKSSDLKHNSSSTENFTVFVTGNHTPSISLDGIGKNRTYEFASTATIVAKTSLDEEVCLSIFTSDLGIDFLCETGKTIRYNFSLANYTSTTVFEQNITERNLFFRENSTETTNANISNALDPISASVDMNGTLSPETITRFNDWNQDQTQKTYAFSDNTSKVLNVTVREGNVMKSMKYILNASGDVFHLRMDACNDGSYDVNQESSFGTDTLIELESVSGINSCINTSKEFNTVPFAFNFGVGGSVTLRSLELTRTERYYAENVYVDVGNDSLIDVALPGQISGLEADIQEFGDGTSTKSIENTEDGLKSELFEVAIPAETEITGFTLVVNSSSPNGTFVEDFSSTEDLNLTETDAVIDTFFQEASNKKVGDVPQESTVLSKIVHTSNTDIEEITWSSNHQELLTGSVITFNISANGGTDWTTATQDGTFDVVPGKNIMWRAFMDSNLVNSTFIYEIEMSGIDSLPQNLSIDIGNDGVSEYNGTGQVNRELTTITVDHEAFSQFQTNPSDGLSTVVLNVSYVGAGSVTLSGLSIRYGLDDVILPAGSINAYKNNQNTGVESVDSLNNLSSHTGTVNETSFNTSNNVIISSSFIELVGDWLQ